MTTTPTHRRTRRRPKTGSEGAPRLLSLRAALILITATLCGIGAGLLRYASAPDVPAAVQVAAAAFVGATVFLNSVIES